MATTMLSRRFPRLWRGAEDATVSFVRPWQQRIQLRLGKDAAYSRCSTYNLTGAAACGGLEPDATTDGHIKAASVEDSGPT